MPIHERILKSVKAVDEKYVNQLLQKELQENKYKIIVLDDDPTGIQTVHGVSVYTNWDEESIRQGFNEKGNLFYILTNSRSFTVNQTTKVHHEISEVVSKISKETGKDYIFVSRSDSTLRGHYPLETRLLKEDYEKYTNKHIDGEIICPFFKEGGRFTIDNIHYVKSQDTLIPANETEFAGDKTFGYTAATLPDYIEEKTKGEYKASDVICISLKDIRELDFNKIQNQLMKIKDFNKIIVNAVDYVDIKVFCIALYRAMAQGKTFMFRTAASFVKIMGNIETKQLLTKDEMILEQTSNGGIIVVGSHTKKTTMQLECLKQLEQIKFIELDATKIIQRENFEKEIQRCLTEEEEYIGSGKTVCCYTTRKLLTANTGDKEDELKLSVEISNAVQSLVGNLNIKPSFIIAKGGITSSDIGIKALGVKKAYVLGQVKPGIPVWRTDEKSKFPMTPYVIFPGNVGEDFTLKEIAEILM